MKQKDNNINNNNFIKTILATYHRNKDKMYTPNTHIYNRSFSWCGSRHFNWTCL